VLAGVLLRVVGVGKYVVWDGVDARVFSMFAGLTFPFSFPLLLPKMCPGVTCGFLSTARLHFSTCLYLFFFTNMSNLILPFIWLIVRPNACLPLPSLYQMLRGILLAPHSSS